MNLFGEDIESWSYLGKFLTTVQKFWVSTDQLSISFLEDTYDVMLCMQNANACLGYCMDIMIGLQVVQSVIGLEGVVGESVDFPVSDN